MRNSSVFAFFMVNALFVLIVFLLQLNKDNLHIKWPLGVKTNITYDETTQEVMYTVPTVTNLLCFVSFALYIYIRFANMSLQIYDTQHQSQSNQKSNTKKHTQARVAQDLLELRNKSVFAFFMFNSLFVLIVFLLQLNKDKLHIEWPFGIKTNITFIEETSEV